MTIPRRYSEDEIALILAQAGAAQERAQDATSAALSSGTGDGLTLVQLQEIGAEVGISPLYVERAAEAVERGVLVPTQQRRWLGLPVGVSRTVDFGRSVSDEEWDRIVVSLRETFEAKGRLQREGSFRQWTNGNLQALLEPTVTGHRLRLSTRKGDAASRVVLGSGLIALASVMWLALVAKGHLTAATMVTPTILGALGAGFIVSMGVQLPRWARTRAAQMESLAARMLELSRTLPGTP